MDIVIQVAMYRDKDGNKEEVSQMLCGGPRVILRENPKVHCRYCCYGFDKQYYAEEKLREHKIKCEE